jgi:hypothetical protein
VCREGEASGAARRVDGTRLVKVMLSAFAAVVYRKRLEELVAIALSSRLLYEITVASTGL